MKHIVCYSGGHSSALVAIEVTRKFGKENVILLNHDINPNVENADIKRFKKEVIRTTANHRWIVPKHNHKSFGYTEKLTCDLEVNDIIPTIYCLPDITPDRIGIQHGFTFGDGSLYQTSHFEGGKFKSRAYVAECKEDILPYFDNEITAKRNIHGLPDHFKILPASNTSNEYILGFVMGLIASDGSVSKSGIMIFNKDRTTLLNIKERLSSLGVVCWVSDEKIRSTNYKQDAALSHLTIPRKSFKKEWLIRSFHKEKYGDKFTEPKSWKVESIVFTGIEEDVFCVVVDDPVYKEFVLDGNILTGNCVGCLKAGRQHWYIVYCTRKDIWEKAKAAEEDIGYTIIKGISLEELEPLFENMRKAEVVPTEHVPHQTFWKIAREKVRNLPEEIEGDNKPCECVF